MERKRRSGIVLSVFLILFGCGIFLALSFLRAPIFASAAEEVAKIEGVGYTDFSEALSHWEEGQTLHLLKNVTITNSIHIDSHKTLNLTGYTLRGNNFRTIWIEKEGSLSVQDSVGTGKISGGGIRVEGELILERGTLCENSTADDGGGVYVLAGGKFTMTGGAIEDNRAAGRGGGIFAEGEVTLGGDARIEHNTGKGGSESNLYLPAGNKIEILENFEGRVGVALSNAEGTFSDFFKSGFFADEPIYETREKEGRAEIRLSPLSKVTAEFALEGTLFPATDPNKLFDFLSLSFENKNGAAYPEEYIKSRSLSIVLGEERAEEFFVGENEVEVSVTGRDGEVCTAYFKVNVSAPTLLKAEADYTQNKVFYFDSEVNAENFSEDLHVMGLYEDNRRREIFSSIEETEEKSGGYIHDFFTLSGSFSEREEDGRVKITVTVHSGEREETCEFFVDVMRYTLYTSEIEVREVKILWGEGTFVSAEDFAPSLPDGTRSRVFLESGEELDSSNLPSGIYKVRIEFYSVDEDNFEIMGPSRSSRLLVYSSSYEGTAGEISYVITCEGGISPEWSFSMKKSDAKVYLRSGLSAGNTFTLTFFPWESADIPESFTVRIFPEKHIAEKKALYLFLVHADGSADELQMTREEGGVVFSANSLNETTFTVAVENNDKILIILSVCFVVLCLGCAGGLVGYLYYKKKKTR